MPPDVCIEINLWDRFGWGPSDTESISLPRLREIFAMLEQQRVSRDAVENLGKPNFQKHAQRMKQQSIEDSRKRHAAEQSKLPPPQAGTTGTGTTKK